MKLTAIVNGKELTFYHLEGTQFNFEGSFNFQKGKTGFVQTATAQFSPITNPKINATKISLKKSEIEKLDTYMIYADGVRISLISLEWRDEQGRKISLIDYSDVHYYFKRSDCGMKKMTTMNGKEYFSVFHSKLSEENTVAKNG